MSQELPSIETTPRPVYKADIQLDSLSASRAEIDKVFQGESIVNLDAVRQFRPEKAIAKESSEVVAITNKIMELRRDRLNKQFFTHVDRRGSFVHSVGRFLGFPVDPKRLESLDEHHLITEEGRLGSMIFGPLEEGEVRREFFFTDANNAYFYKRVQDISGNEDELTLHYEVVPQGILKISSRPGIPNHLLTGHELDNFVTATKAYFHEVCAMYNSDEQITTQAA